MVEPVYGLHNVLLRLPGLVFTVGFLLEEIGTPDMARTPTTRQMLNMIFFMVLKV